MADEKIFADGFSFKRQEKAPDFVVGRLSLKVEDAIAFMEKHTKGGWVNLNIKTAKSGAYYVELDTYEPKAFAPTPTPVVVQQQPRPVAKVSEDLPF